MRTARQIFLLPMRSALTFPSLQLYKLERELSSFIEAGAQDHAEQLYEYIISECQKRSVVRRKNSGA